jgi:hypothetical protein
VGVPQAARRAHVAGAVTLSLSHSRVGQASRKVDRTLDSCSDTLRLSLASNIYNTGLRDEELSATLFS